MSTLPKEERSRERARRTTTYEVDPDAVYGPPLPNPLGVLPEGETWHPMTKRWWHALRRYPLLKNEPDTSWNSLLATALMHHTMWTRGRWEFAAEIRIREAKFGITPADRNQMGIKLERPQAEPAPHKATGTDDATVVRGRFKNLI